MKKIENIQESIQDKVIESRNIQSFDLQEIKEMNSTRVLMQLKKIQNQYPQWIDIKSLVASCGSYRALIQKSLSFFYPIQIDEIWGKESRAVTKNLQKDGVKYRTQHDSNTILSPLRIDTGIPGNEVVAELIRRMQDVEVGTGTIEKKISKLSLDVHEANNTPLNIKHSLSKTQAIDYLQSLKNKGKLEIIQFGKSIQRYIELSGSLKKHCTATYSYNEYSKISKYGDLNFVYSNPYTLDDVIGKISLLDFIQCTPSQQKKEITKDRRSKQHVY